MLSSIVSNVCFISSVLEWTTRALWLSNHLRASHWGILEEASITSGRGLSLHSLVRNRGPGGKRHPQSRLVPAHWAPAREPGCDQRSRLDRRWLLARSTCWRDGGRHLLPLLSRRFLPLAHQSRRSQIGDCVCKRIRHVPEVGR